MSDVIRAKLETLDRCMRRIGSQKPFTVEQLETDFDLQDIVLLNLQRAIQACVDMGSHLLHESNRRIPGTMGDVFKTLHAEGFIDARVASSMQKAAGFRNVLVHDYTALDMNVVHAVVTDGFDDITAFARQIRAACDI